MDYSEKLIRQIYQLGRWQCSNCKPCQICRETNEDVSHLLEFFSLNLKLTITFPSSASQDAMIFCDGCDRGYHMACHRPPVLERPSSKWECAHCAPLPPPAPSIPQVTEAPSPLAAPLLVPASEEEDTRRFLPLLPPHLHPRRSALPDNWEDYDVDPQIPDVTEWEPVHLRDFFSQKGFSDALSSIFLEQVRLLNSELFGTFFFLQNCTVSFKSGQQKKSGIA